MVLQNYDVDINFWNVNKGYRTFKLLEEIYQKDSSKNKIKSSKLMWAMAFLVEKNDNPYNSYSEEEKRELIAENVLDNSSFKWEECDDLIEFWKHNSMVAMDRTIIELENKLDERNKFLRDTKYDIDNAKDLDAIFANTQKIQELLEGMKTKRDKKESGSVRGGASESAIEKGLI